MGRSSIDIHENKEGEGLFIDKHQIKILVLYTENSKGPDMHPLQHGVLQDTSQMTTSTI